MSAMGQEYLERRGFIYFAFQDIFLERERTRKRSSWIGHHQISLPKLLQVASQEKDSESWDTKISCSHPQGSWTLTRSPLVLKCSAPRCHGTPVPITSLISSINPCNTSEVMKGEAFISNIMSAMVAGILGEKRVYLFRLSGYIPGNGENKEKIFLDRTSSDILCRSFYQLRRRKGSESCDTKISCSQ
ncbi:hypothetical protein CDAR_187201 [Caerostris darwini]|uniref:Uncharacterized protein n=1 Tax=Caerostris darwini TaxID=1538125 RepID=A0AAV4P524_9ARAC|nr:hypothetical protein CDAR_187201 [Caerostris darwini]